MPASSQALPLALAVFDWNGTLFDDAALAEECAAHVIRSFARHLEVPKLEDYRLEPAIISILDFLRGEGAAPSAEEAIFRWREYYGKHVKEKASLSEGTELALNYCTESNLQLALLTRADQGTVFHLERLGILKQFTGLRFGAFDKTAALRSLLQEFNVEPGQAFYLDDTVDGIEQAQKAGVHVVGFAQGYHSEKRLRAETHGVPIIRSLQELPEVLHSLLPLRKTA